MLEQQNDVEPQPFLPRVGILWFFVLMTLVAVAMGIVRAAEQGWSLLAALICLVIFVFVFALISCFSFVVAFLFGAMEKAMADDNQETASPFIDGSMPEQIIPPQPVDGS